MEKFTAEQAREMAENKRLEVLSEILNLIREEAGNGEDYAYYYGTIEKEVLKELEARDFSVELRPTSFRNDVPSYRIGW